jgi:hypothetical protein
VKKKRKLTQTEYLAYKKQHDYDDVVATEESKVSNEKETFAALQVKGKQRLQQKIKLLIDIEDPELLEDDLEIPEEEIIANRKIRNARTHKHRLHGLREYEEDI